MAKKSLRILIADPQHFHRMMIERFLNGLQYYRVAPVQDIVELVKLVECSCEPFDLVVINAQMAGTSLNLAELFAGSPYVHHALIYNAPSMPLRALSSFAHKNVHISESALPTVQSIEQLMDFVDVSRSQKTKGLKLVPPSSAALNVRHTSTVASKSLGGRLSGL